MVEAEVGDTARLVRQAKGGDREALNRLFERFAPLVRRIVALKLGASPARREDVDDRVQDALVRAFEGLEKFGDRPEDDFRAWLACCARCAIFDDYKRVHALKRGGGKRVANFTEYGSDYLRSSIFAGREPTPSQLAMRAELEGAVHEALMRMEERHRRIIIYRKLCDYSYEEIARLLKLKDVNNARVLCHRAIRRLESLLEA